MVSNIRNKMAHVPGQLFLLGVLCFSAFVLGATVAAYAKETADPSSIERRLINGADIKQVVNAVLAEKGLIADIRIADATKYYPCSGSLDVSSRFGGWKTVSVKCAQASPWEIMVRTYAQPAAGGIANATANDKGLDGRTKRRVVLLTSLRPGDLVAPQDIEIRNVMPAAASGGFERLSDVIGRKLKRPINTGMVVSARHLEPDWMVVEDQSVSIVNDLSGFTIVTAGKVLKNGRFGDRVQVENAASGEIIDVFVESEKKVTIRPKMSVN